MPKCNNKDCESCVYGTPQQGGANSLRVDTCCGCQGLADCNTDLGQVWTAICAPTCVVPCVDAHEGQHRYDLSSCCSLVPKCIAYYTKNPLYTDGRSARYYCQAVYDEWFSRNRRWMECRAYRSGLDCAQKWIKAHTCACGTPINPDKCCNEMCNFRALQYSGYYDFCPGVSPLGPIPCKCPFNNDGSVSHRCEK